MALSEDLGLFLADFGVPCKAGSQQFLGLLDQPDEVLQIQRGAVLTREHELTFITSAAVLTRQQAITVGGVAYTVREAPRQLQDGAFSRVLLTKT